MGKNTLFRKFTQWEYWPAYMFYTPNIPYALYLSIKALSLVFYSATNPGIKSSGNGTESKFKNLEMIPDEFKPKSIFVPKERIFDTVLKQVQETGITFPLIAKPDIGFRGLFVKKIHHPEELKTYLEKHPLDLIVQDFIDFPYECGVFFHKIPGEEKGTVSSITLKSYMHVEGDGVSTISQLVHKDARAKHYIEKLKEINIQIWDSIPEKGKSVVLSEIGNHARGTQFFNGSKLIDNELIETFNTLSSQIPGLFYGRFDIKYQSFDELRMGKNFKFLEVNGIIAEPTHIYDAQTSTYFNALRIFRRQWDTIYKIATENHKRGVPYMEFWEFWNQIAGLMRYVKNIKKLSKAQGEL